MRFVGLALISALAASGATWGCQNAQPPAPGTSETASLPAPAAARLSPNGIAAGAEMMAGPRPGVPSAAVSPGWPGVPDVVRGVTNASRGRSISRHASRAAG
jgi:hypothetical protein